MKKVSYILLSLLGLMACENELFEEGGSMAPALDGTMYVIDYSADAGGTTKSIHENLPANQRISSLTYLLYEGTEGTLVKRREIPDIGEQTTWPLKREKMTWAQREALKDTLSVERIYRVVFIANIDSSKLGWEDENGDLCSPLRNPGRYADAYLCYPTDKAFTDNSMFYWFNTTIEPVSVDRDTPYNCPVILRRVVTRTDVLTEHFPAWEGIDGTADGEEEQSIPEEVKAFIEPYVRSLFTEAVGETTNTNAFISVQVDEKMKDLLTSISKYFNDQIIPKPEDVELTEEQIASNANYTKWRDAVNKLIDELDHESVFTFLLQKKPYEALMSPLRTDCLNNQDLRTLWKASWRLGDEAVVTFNQNTPDDPATATGVARISLDQTTAIGVGESPYLPVDSSAVLTQDGIESQYDLFTWIGFGDPNNNIFEKISFYTEGVDTPEELPVSDLKTGQSGNEWYQLIYRPMRQLGFGETLTDRSEATNVPGDFKQILNFSSLTQQNAEGQEEPWSQEEINALIAAMNQADILGENGKYAEQKLDAITFPITLKDLSQSGALKFTESWTIQKVQGR